jgi:integrase
METKRGHLRASTAHNYELSIRLYIMPYLANYKLNELSRGVVQSWIDTLGSKKVGARTIEVCHMVLHNSLEHARQIGMIVGNPTEHVMLPKAKEREMGIWTESQITQFLASIRGDANEVLYQLALATGMRRGELLGLQWKDIDWSGRISVTRQAIRTNHAGYTFGDVKTARGRRTIEIGMGMVERLRFQEQRVHEMRKVFAKRWEENDLVFPTQLGTPRCGSNLDRLFIALARQAGVPVIRFHDLRHTAATIMLSHGIPAVIVAGMLGHTVSVLMTRYAHYIPSMQGEAARLMDEITTVTRVDKV